MCHPELASPSVALAKFGFGIRTEIDQDLKYIRELTRR
jgi:hypothetical protein